MTSDRKLPSRRVTSRRSVLAGLAASTVALPAAAQTAKIPAPPQQAASPAQPATPQRPFRIYMALWRGWESGTQGFKDYLVNQNIPVELIIRDAGQDRSKIPAMIKEVREMRPDMLYAWGTTVTLDMCGPFDGADPAKHITDIPTIFALVSQPVESRIAPDLKSSGRPNLAGATLLIDEETQLKAMFAYKQPKRVAIIVNRDEPNSLVSLERIRALSKPMGFDLVSEEIPLDASNRPIASAIPMVMKRVADQKPDWLYMGSSSFILVNRDAFTQAALENKLPTFSAGEIPVTQSKALAGLAARYYNVGQLLGYQAAQILVQKKRPIDLPVASLSRYSFIINMPVARELKLYPPMNLLPLAEIRND